MNIKLSGIKALRWVSTTVVILFFRKTIGRVQSNKNGRIFFHSQPHKARTHHLIRKIKRETEMLLSKNEAYQVFLGVRQTEKIEGDIAEVGVYKGGSAKVISEAKGERTLHLFDTFEGLPDVRDVDTFYCKGQYNASLDDVKNYLKKYRNVRFYKGMFPESADSVKNKSFSFVNLDVDIYESTLNSLKFFYPRMSVGGMIISHDYANAAGVKKAFKEFFADRVEEIIELLGSQCLVVKS